MAQLVCQNFSNLSAPLSLSPSGAMAEDYVPVIIQQIDFKEGEVIKNHTIRINQDHLLETDPNEFFYSLIRPGPGMSVGTGVGDVQVTVERATITIDDSSEPENGLY